MLKKLPAILGLLFIVLLVAAWLWLPPQIDRRLNKVDGPTVNVSERAKALHKTLTIIDLHADSLLWGRDQRLSARIERVRAPRHEFQLLSVGAVAVGRRGDIGAPLS